MNNFKYNISRPYPVFSEGGGAGGQMRRTGYMDQTKKETKPQHDLESALFDAGKFMLNTVATPFETISETFTRISFLAIRFGLSLEKKCISSQIVSVE